MCFFVRSDQPFSKQEITANRNDIYKKWSKSGTTRIGLRPDAHHLIGLRPDAPYPVYDSYRFTTTNIGHGTTNADAGVGVGIKRGEPLIKW